jgi:hypothetical protein
MRLYAIKYTWPSGKVRYRTDAGLTSDIDTADQYTWEDSKTILELAKDAKTIWGIVATMHRTS